MYKSYNDLLEGPAVQLIRPIDLLELIDETSTSYHSSQDDPLAVSPIYVDSYTNINTSSPNSIIDGTNFPIKEFVNQIRSQLSTIGLSNNNDAAILLTWLYNKKFTQPTYNAFIKSICKDLWEGILHIDVDQCKVNLSHFQDELDIEKLSYDTFCMNLSTVFKVT